MPSALSLSEAVLTPHDLWRCPWREISPGLELKYLTLTKDNQLPRLALLLLESSSLVYFASVDAEELRSCGLYGTAHLDDRDLVNVVEVLLGLRDGFGGSWNRDKGVVELWGVSDGIRLEMRVGCGMLSQEDRERVMKDQVVGWMRGMIRLQDVVIQSLRGKIDKLMREKEELNGHVENDKVFFNYGNWLRGLLGADGGAEGDLFSVMVRRKESEDRRKMMTEAQKKQQEEDMKTAEQADVKDIEPQEGPAASLGIDKKVKVKEEQPEIPKKRAVQSVAGARLQAQRKGKRRKTKKGGLFG